MNAATYLAGLPSFLAYFAVSIGLLLAFALVYSAITPHHEFRLIREGKNAAAVAFGGSLLGFVLPLHSAISHSVNLVDCALWGGVAFVVQLATFFALRLVIRDLPQRITRDELASGVFVACVSIAVGLLNAACMTS
jgi:putative membrane protein